MKLYPFQTAQGKNELLSKHASENYTVTSSDLTLSKGRIEAVVKPNLFNLQTNKVQFPYFVIRISLMQCFHNNDETSMLHPLKANQNHRTGLYSTLCTVALQIKNTPNGYQMSLCECFHIFSVSFTFFCLYFAQAVDGAKEI